MAPSAQSIVKKADIAVANLQSSGGYLETIQANTFLRMVQEQPTLLKSVRYEPMEGPEKELNAIGFGSRILHGTTTTNPVTAPSAAMRSRPTTSRITLTTKKAKAVVVVPYDVLEDNIERGRLEDTIVELAAAQIALDLEDYIINADSLTITTDEDDLLGMGRGLLSRITSHTVDYTSSPPTAIDQDIFKATYKALPNKYQVYRSDLRFLANPLLEIEHASYLAERATNLGDARLISNYQGALSPFGVPLVSCAKMPEENMVLTFPKNIIFGVQREIMLETDRDILAEAIYMVWTIRFDVQLETEDACVKVLGLNPGDLN